MSGSGQLGVLVPLGGGDPIPLLKDRLTVGRRPSCDVCLSFPNVSGTHCEFVFQNGYWSVSDLGSSNGVKVKGEKVTRKKLLPGDEVSVASHRFAIRYDLPAGAGADEVAEEEDLFAESLLKKAGLEKMAGEVRRHRG